MSLEYVGKEIYIKYPEPDELFPLRYLGDGVRQLVRIFSNVIIAQNKVLLIDELENGIYYKKIPLLLEFLDKLSKEYNVQLIITTHSDDVIENLPKLSDYSLFRLHQRFENGYLRLSKDKADQMAQNKNIDIR